MATILIADDDPQILNLLVRFLSRERNGTYILKSASNGKEVLDLIRQGGIDAVILDNTMPEIPGLQVAGLAHTAGILPPGILHSGEDYIRINGMDYSTHLIAKESGLFGAVYKPSDPDVLKGLVTDLLTAGTNAPSFDNLRRYFAEQWKDNNWQPPQARSPQVQR